MTDIFEWGADPLDTKLSDELGFGATFGKWHVGLSLVLECYNVFIP